ncbi:hypothetical protein EDB80DRAFT_628499, partial [Ilyonectria destructans]
MYFNIHQGGRRGVPAQFAALLREWWQEDVGVSSHSSDLAAAIEQQACVTVAGSTQIGSLINLKDLLHRRYERAGQTEDLDEAVQVMRHAVGLLPKPSHFLNLGFLLLELYEETLDQTPPADLDEPVRLGRDAISMAQVDHPEDVPWHLSCLAFGLRSRYSIIKNPEDLAEAITLSARAVDMAPKDHPGRPFYLIVHAIGLSCRYSHTARLLDLYESIRLGLEAWSISSRGDTLADHHNQFWCAGNLALWFTGRYLREGTGSDLERAVEFRQHADSAALIINNGEPVDLYDMHLGARNTVTPDTSDRHIVLLGKEGIPDYPSRLFNVAVEQFKLYSEESEARDLSSATFLCGFSVAATPSGHLQRQVRVLFLGKCVMARYALKRGVDALGSAMAQNESAAEDLDDAIYLLQEVIIAASPEHSAWYPSVHSLGPLYMDRYHHSGDLGDLQMALLALQKSADATPRDHPLRPSRLRCLGDAKQSSYAIFNRVADLDEAQRLFQEVIE